MYQYDMTLYETINRSQYLQFFALFESLNLLGERWEASSKSRG